MDEKSDLSPEKTEIGNAKYCSYVDGLYVYKDPSTNYEYVWNESQKAWTPKSSGGESAVQYDGNSYTYTDKDGTSYEWDNEKSAWFPKVKAQIEQDNKVIDGTNDIESPSTTKASVSGFHNPNYEITLQNPDAASPSSPPHCANNAEESNTESEDGPRRFYYAALSPSNMGVNEPVLFLSPDDQVNNNSTIPPQENSVPSVPTGVSGSSDHIVQDNKASCDIASELPSGWEKHEDANGPYFWHIKSGTIQRDRPTKDNVVSSTVVQNPALLIPGSLQQNPVTSPNARSISSITGTNGVVRRSQTISTQLSSSIMSSSSNFNSNCNKNNSIPITEKRKSWSQYLDSDIGSVQNMSISSLETSSRRDESDCSGFKDPSKKSLKFVVVSLGKLGICEEDLTPERSSRAVSKVIAELTNPNSKIAAGVEIAGWGGGSELILDLDESHLRVKTKDDLIVAEQAIHSIRVWGVGRDDPRDFAYVAREKHSRQFLCHVFRLEMNARPLASALRDACKRIMIERQQKQKRPNTLPTGLRKPPLPAPSKPPNTANITFPTPMDEPRKVIKAFYLGSKMVQKPTGMEILNAAIDCLRNNVPIPVAVSVAPSVLHIASENDSQLDEEFLARYRLSYGVGQYGGAPVLPEASEAECSSKIGVKRRQEQQEDESDESSKKQKKNVPNQAQWFDLDDARNTNVYVSNLPNDITTEEFIEVMQKCGLIQKDPKTNEFKVKLYEHQNGEKKGDGLCSYIKVESVDLALQILDGYDVKGKRIKVEKARFTLKGEYDPSKKPKQKKKKEKLKDKMKQEALLAWKPEKLRGQRSKHERVVVVKNAFSPSDFDKDVGLILEFNEDFREEAGKFGTCKKVVVYDRHPEGVVQIFMEAPEEADAVIECFNNRFFGGRQLTAETYDGRSKFKMEETEAQREDRIKTWEKFIENEPSSSGSKSPKIQHSPVSKSTEEDRYAVTPPREDD